MQSCLEALVQRSIFTAFHNVYDVPFVLTAARSAASAFVGVQALLQHCSKGNEETSLLRSAVVKNRGCALTFVLLCSFASYSANMYGMSAKDLR